MRCFVTGGTGFLGGQLCRTLIDQHHEVIVFARQTGRQTAGFSPNVKFVCGDILNADGLAEVFRGCRFGFHLAAYAKPWAENRNEYYRINVQGTKNVLEAAAKSGVEKLVFVSTAGIYGPSRDESDFLDESSVGDERFKTEYERTKLQAEHFVKKFAMDEKIDVVIVNPTRIYGPGRLSESNAVTMILKRILQRQIQFLPNSEAVGNYVFVADVVDGMIAALERGRSCQNYILGGENVAWNVLLKQMQLATRGDGQSVRIWKLPEFTIQLAAWAEEWKARLTGAPAKITREFFRKYKADYFLSSQLAKNELGYEPIALSEGLTRTANWLRASATNESNEV